MAMAAPVRLQEFKLCLAWWVPFTGGYRGLEIRSVQGSGPSLAPSPLFPGHAAAHSRGLAPLLKPELQNFCF